MQQWPPVPSAARGRGSKELKPAIGLRDVEVTEALKTGLGRDEGGSHDVTVTADGGRGRGARTAQVQAQAALHGKPRPLPAGLALAGRPATGQLQTDVESGQVAHSLARLPV